MQKLISVAINAVAEGLKLANTHAARKYVDKLYDLQMKILKEEDRRYDADAPYLESLYAELKITLEASENEIRLAQARASN